VFQRLSQISELSFKQRGSPESGPQPKNGGDGPKVQLSPDTGRLRTPAHGTGGLKNIKFLIHRQIRMPVRNRCAPVSVL
jgi:hypothetical protein